MSDLHSISKEALSVLAEKGSFPYSFTLTESEKRELNTEGSEFSLFRTVFNRQISVTTIPDGRKGSASGNDLSPEGIKKVVSDALSGAESALPDEANCIAEKKHRKFSGTVPTSRIWRSFTVGSVSCWMPYVPLIRKSGFFS